ncbi:MAG: hypothetical protein ABI550_00945 [Ignavibacteriaceae bacterium]
MKIKYVSLAFVFLAAGLFAQDAKVPSNVKESFKKLHPKASEVKWDKEGANEFEANFKENNNSVSVVLDSEGKLVETETVMKTSELSKNIHSFISKNYKGYEITEAAKIIDANGNVSYEAEVSKGKVKKDVVFDKDGKLMKKNDKKSEDENNEKEDEEDKD